MSVLKKLFTWKSETDYKTFDDPPIPTAPVARVNLSDLDDDPTAGADGTEGTNHCHLY